VTRDVQVFAHETTDRLHVTGFLEGS
jgi:hypothetical protein